MNLTPITSAYYRNGRFGTNRASVSTDASGAGYFCNGYGDPIRYANAPEAESAFYNFIADQIPEDGFAVRILERNA